MVSLAFSREGNRLASYSKASYIRIWDTATWTLCTVICDPQVMGRLMFDAFSSHLLIGWGTIRLAPNVQKAGGRLSCPSRHLDVILSNWIAWGGHNVIWLPVDHRPLITAISPVNSIIALGCEAHGIDIIGFPDEGPPDLQQAQLEDEQKGYRIYDVLEATESPQPQAGTFEDLDRQLFCGSLGPKSNQLLARRK